MKKPDKNAEEKTDELVHDEGEPRSHMDSEYENPAIANGTLVDVS